ncbi:hypothetical protein L6164_022480 [Bauhinia variegata]|uniref:Uncharacterized protein n=1 Tax=Bauhinia variegata TaxID=167791 RepID=A0ACB9MFC1_BAUVA|nr:hypothetical protein L6164_022480 [Bauhinia variegata]
MPASFCLKIYFNSILVLSIAREARKNKSSSELPTSVILERLHLKATRLLEMQYVHNFKFIYSSILKLEFEA